jgi:hypothetical protein
LGILLILVALPACQNDDHPLPMQRESGQFVFFCKDQDAGVIDSFLEQLETAYPRIAEDIGYWLDDTVYVEIYPNPTAFRKALGAPNLPEWVVAQAGGRDGHVAIMVVSPNNPGSVHTRDFVQNRVAVHELAQSMIYRKHERRPAIWLLEGLATYEGDNLTLEEARAIISEQVIAGDVPTLRDLQPANDERVSEGRFNELNGYEYSYTLIDFIVQAFGMAKVRELLDAPEYPYDYEEILGLTETEFYDAWVGFLRDNYTISSAEAES